MVDQPIGRFYYNMKNKSFVGDDIRVMVLESMRPEVIRQLDSTHLGKEKKIKNARCTLYSPVLDFNIEHIPTLTQIFQKLQNKTCKKPLNGHEIPEFPFQKVGFDILEFSGISYLVLMDYYSQWLELKKMRNKTGKEVILK